MVRAELWSAKLYLEGNVRMSNVAIAPNAPMNRRSWTGRQIRTRREFFLVASSACWMLLRARPAVSTDFWKLRHAETNAVQSVGIFISNGSDTNRYRDTASDVLARLRQLLQYELHYDVTLANWDYRRASPTVVPSGTMAATSLSIVDQSHALVAIFGRRCPRITCQEIRRAIERRVSGERIEVFIFLNPGLRTPEHDTFFNQLGADFAVEPVWAAYTSQVTFQAQLFTTLMRFLLEHLEISNPGLISGAA
jgi:hypothetical protein